MEPEPETSRIVVERTIRSAVKAVCRYSSPQRYVCTPRMAKLMKNHRHKASSVEKVYLASSYSGRVLFAEDSEIQRVAEEYAKIGDKYAVFEKMFLQLFLEEDVKLAVHFGLDGLQPAELRTHQKFRTHVGKFQRFMNMLMSLLSKGAENNENVVKMLRLIGRQHTNVRTMSFTAEKWLIFKNVLLSLMCNDHDMTYPTWSRLISFVIYEIKDAYLENVRHLRSSSCPHIAELSLLTSELSVSHTPRKRQIPGSLSTYQFIDLDDE